MAASPLHNAEILLLEDDGLLRKRLTAYLERSGAVVTGAASLAEARRCLSALPFDFALLDIHLPDGESLDLLREKAFSANTGVVVMTAEGGVKLAVEAMKLGAGDYLAKPFDPEELPLVLQRLKKQNQQSRAGEFEKQQKSDDSFFFGSSLADLKSQLERILQTDRRLRENLPPVLLEGETGTGKTALARWLHREGPRAEGPLIEVNCSALPENLVESELFGHERGAFTDAKSARIGLFEAAGGGTLFLDEINSLSLPIQAKILTTIEDRKIRRVGGNKPISVDVRIIAASNQDLRTLAAKGAFREDLYHRLDLLRLRLPPLRERGHDILQLAEHMLSALAKRYRVKNARLSEAGRTRLLRYAWPGNVRELAHELERALILDDEGEISFSQLPVSGQPTAEVSTDSSPAARSTRDWLAPGWRFPEEGFSLEEAINRMVTLALAQTEGNVSAAARLLGVTRDYVRYRMNVMKK